MTEDAGDGGTVPTELTSEMAERVERDVERYWYVWRQVVSHVEGLALW